MNQSHLRLPPEPRACVMGLRWTRGEMRRSLLHPGAGICRSLGQGEARLPSQPMGEWSHVSLSRGRQSRDVGLQRAAERRGSGQTCVSSPQVACANPEHMGAQVGGRKCFRVRQAVSTEN